MASSKALYKLSLDCGDMGTLTGSFVAEKEDIEYLTNSSIRVYFGAVLGEHSEVASLLDSNDIKLLTDDPSIVSQFEKINGIKLLTDDPSIASQFEKMKLSSQFNPLERTAWGIDKEDLIARGYEVKKGEKYSNWTVKQWIDFFREAIPSGKEY